MLKLMDFGDLKDKKYKLFLKGEESRHFPILGKIFCDVHMMICIIYILELKK